MDYKTETIEIKIPNGLKIKLGDEPINIIASEYGWSGEGKAIDFIQTQIERDFISKLKVGSIKYLDKQKVVLALSLDEAFSNL